MNRLLPIQDANPGLQLTQTGGLFLAMMGVGVLAALLYDIFRTFRKASGKNLGKTPVLLVHLQDLAFLVGAFCLFTLVVYVGNQGEVRGYMLVGAALGAGLYVLLLSPVLGWILYGIFTIILLPFRYLVLVPGRWLGRRVTSWTQNFKKIVKTTRPNEKSTI